MSNHGFVLFDEVLRVPLVVSYPRILREASARVPPELRGRDLRGAMRGTGSGPADRAVFPAVMRALGYLE